MEEYSRIKNFGHLVLLITFAGLTALSLLTGTEFICGKMSIPKVDNNEKPRHTPQY
jgi:hypothetical protein